MKNKMENIRNIAGNIAEKTWNVYRHAVGGTVILVYLASLPVQAHYHLTHQDGSQIKGSGAIQEETNHADKQSIIDSLENHIDYLETQIKK